MGREFFFYRKSMELEMEFCNSDSKYMAYRTSCDKYKRVLIDFLKRLLYPCKLPVPAN